MNRNVRDDVDAKAQREFERQYRGSRWDELPEVQRDLWRAYVRNDGHLPPR